MSLEDDIKKAELDKLNQEIENLRSEQRKTDKEKEEIDKRLNTPFLKSRNFIQILITALAAGPLIWFYFTNAIQPVLEHNKYELTNLRDSLSLAIKQYKIDTARFSEESRELSNRLDQIDQENQDLATTLVKFQNDYNDCISGNSQIEEEITKQISRVRYNLNFGQLNTYKIGFYYYPEQVDIAKELEAYLISEGFTGTTQLYPRSDSFFSNVNPQKGFEIRYEQSYERNSAEKLKEILDRYQNNVSFSLRTVSSRTAGFISVFIPKGL